MKNGSEDQGDQRQKANRRADRDVATRVGVLRTRRKVRALAAPRRARSDKGRSERDPRRQVGDDDRARDVRGRVVDELGGQLARRRDLPVFAHGSVGRNRGSRDVGRRGDADLAQEVDGAVIFTVDDVVARGRPDRILYEEKTRVSFLRNALSGDVVKLRTKR